jgi:hypothetical protein
MSFGSCWIGETISPTPSNSSLGAEHEQQARINTPHWTKWDGKQIETAVGDIRQWNNVVAFSLFNSSDNRAEIVPPASFRLATADSKEVTSLLAGATDREKREQMSVGEVNGNGSRRPPISLDEAAEKQKSDLLGRQDSRPKTTEAGSCSLQRHSALSNMGDGGLCHAGATLTIRRRSLNAECRDIDTSTQY